MLQIHQYVKSYGPEPVLQIPELNLPAGIYHIAGENGAGKTTFLKSIAGLIPFKGTIEVNGISINRQRMHYRKAVSYAEVEPLYPEFLTGQDLLHFYLQTKGGLSKEAYSIAGMLGVEKYMHNKIATYSSGMVKKLSLLLAFVGKPQLILLDEPLITLDPEAVQTIVHLIGSSHNRGVGFLITSHQLLELPVAYTSLKVSGGSLHFNSRQ